MRYEYALSRRDDRPIALPTAIMAALVHKFKDALGERFVSHNHTHAGVTDMITEFIGFLKRNARSSGALAGLSVLGLDAYGVFPEACIASGPELAFVHQSLVLLRQDAPKAIKLLTHRTMRKRPAVLRVRWVQNALHGVHSGSGQDNDMIDVSQLFPMSLVDA
jgi:hypothetical protein